jgi:hypothetical protein
MNDAEAIYGKLVSGLREGNNWICYDTKSFPVVVDDLYMFKSNDEAIHFVSEVLEETGYRIFHTNSLEDALKVFPQMPAILENENWITLNLVTNDHYFFKNEDEANQFAQDNVSDGDRFSVHHFESVNEAHQILNNKNLQVMNEENVEYLEKSLLYTGFGDKLNESLKENMKTLAPEFQLEHKATIGTDETNAKLYFRKSEKSDHYFFNKYDMSLKSPDQKAERTQTFYMDKGKGNITAKESYNLLSGRAVYKELENQKQEKYHAWLQLNFELKDKHGNNIVKQYHENYGYNIKKELGKHPIKEMQSPASAEMLIKSLEKGNLHSVFMDADGKGVKHFIEANPQSRSINVYDSEMKQAINKTQKQDQKQEQGQDKKEDKKEDLKEDKKKDHQIKKDDSLEEKHGRSKKR